LTTLPMNSSHCTGVFVIKTFLFSFSFSPKLGVHPSHQWKLLIFLCDADWSCDFKNLNFFASQFSVQNESNIYIDINILTNDTIVTKINNVVSWASDICPLGSWYSLNRDLG
jgi:hypothetical protein